MNTNTAYTPLESLLLFQSLATNGTDPSSFIRTSELLKNNALVRAGETFDPGRLSSDALRELYLQLLREELKNEALQGDDGSASPSKKRKLQSPPLSNIKDANEYSEKLPQLVDRLYSRYTDVMVRAIREDERQYQTLQREIEEIERGEWDERILKEDRSRANASSSLPAENAKTQKASSATPVPPSTVQEKPSDATSSGTAQQDTPRPPTKPSTSPTASTLPDSRHEGLAINDVLNSQDATPTATPAPTPTSPRIQRDLLSHTRNGSQGPPAAPQQQSSPHQRNPSSDRLHGPSPLQSQQRPDWKWENQYQGGPPAPHQQGISPYQPNPNYPQYQPYPPYPTPHRPLISSPHVLPPPVPSSPHNVNHPSNQMVLPPSSNAGRGGSPAQPLDALADMAGQQYRQPQGSPSMQHGPSPSPGYGPYPVPPPYRPDGRPPPGNGQPQQWNQPPYMPAYGQPPNFYPPPQPGQRPFTAPSNIIQPEQRPYNSPYNPSQGPPGPRPSLQEQQKPSPLSSTPRARQSRDLGILPHTPSSFGRAPFSTGKATRWTPTPSVSTPKAPKSPKQPVFEPLSPVLLPAKTPTAVPKSTRSKKIEKVETPASNSRGRSSRGSQRARAGSAASSVVAASYRSQSVMSHADELSLDNEGASRKVKQESSTPRPVEETGDTTADEGTVRKKKGNLRDIASPKRPQKRKRESPVHEPPGPPTQVQWTRNFPKISASALERIGAHRNASTFAQPIKERDAPGYKDVILRPQDLKSIRTSLTAGNKAGAAIVTSSMEDTGQASFNLPISEDLIPPKGIVNNAQLEKELMHMFANAIMFNLDPDRGFGRPFPSKVAKAPEQGMENYKIDENGVVKDTRAMFADVEKIVGEMRSAERRSEQSAEVEDEEMDELAGDGDQSGGVAKRRRRA